MDGRLVAQLVQAAVPVLTVLALALALRPRRAQAPATRSLARAQWITVAVALPGTYLLAVTVVRAVEGNPLGIVVYLTACGYVAAGAAALRWVWSRHVALAEEFRTASAEPGPPARHRGLSGQDVPPTRW